MSGRRLRELYTFQQLAELLDRSPRTVSRWLKRTGVPIEQIGNERGVWLSDLYARKPQWFESRRIIEDLEL